MVEKTVHDQVQRGENSGAKRVQSLVAMIRETLQETTQTVSQQQLMRGIAKIFQCLQNTLAERTGFEPADQFPGHRFSKPTLSTTQPPLLSCYEITTYI
jgi:hypothetical protein